MSFRGEKRFKIQKEDNIIDKIIVKRKSRKYKGNGMQTEDK
jgi:hypothetical protein